MEVIPDAPADASAPAPGASAQPAGERGPGSDEHLTPVHRAAGRDGAADGGAAAVGHPGVPPAAGLRAAAGRLSDDPHSHLLSGRQPGGHDERRDGAARTAVRPAARAWTRCRRRARAARRSSRCASRSRSRSRSPSRKCRRRSTPPTSLLPNDLPQPPVYNKVNPADTPVLTLAITSATMPLPQVHDLVDTRVAQKLSQVPGVGPGEHRRRTAARGAHPGQSAGARRARAEPADRLRRSSPPPTSTSRRATSTGPSDRSCSTPTISFARPRPTGI